MLERPRRRAWRARHARLRSAGCRRDCSARHLRAADAVEIDASRRSSARCSARCCTSLRYARRDWTSVIDAINATGYGLTSASTRRIDETSARRPRQRTPATSTSTAT